VGVGGEMNLRPTRLLSSSPTATKNQSARTGEDGQGGGLGDGGADRDVVNVIEKTRHRSE